MARTDRQEDVQNILRNLRGLDGLKRLFWEELNYDRENLPLSMRGWPDSTREALAEDPVLFASGGEDGAFHILYCRLATEQIKRGGQRPVVTRLLREHPYALFVFSNGLRSEWHFLNVKLARPREGEDGQGTAGSRRRLFRRLTVRQGEGLRTAAERLQMLDLDSFGRDLFGLPALEIQQRHDEAFDVEKVTREFYRELANWYFWASQCDGIVFPLDVKTRDDQSLFLIRLITRLIFCWFLREKRNPETGKGLLPDELFDPNSIPRLIKNPSGDSSTYYTAVLQNLFFATLNTEMDEPGRPPKRRFIDEGDGRQSEDHMVHQLWRHRRQLSDPEGFAELMRGVPFLNGGLFECLDERKLRGESNFTVEVRMDGFSTSAKKQPRLPNFLFFGLERRIDLSDAYGDAKRKGETVRPLLSILRRYNFTLSENTPIEQEVALDPELLGHVFENLLAAYNPETGMIARKATGSFYTPRVVVDWMVDQALLLYLGKALDASSANSDGKALRELLSWEDTSAEFTPVETNRLIQAVDELKALDPACGSGAFLMGLLQKLVHALQKLDPDNQRWQERQRDAAQSIESSLARDEALHAIERAFARDNDDYGRKLFLIENCIYGVDIQPIATQIAKLRFFISMIVDQAIDPEEPNIGILPLPNLETRIVAANTVMGLHRGQLLLGSVQVRAVEEDLQQLRHNYFTARSYRRKKDLRMRDRELSRKLAEELIESGECTPYDSKRLADWNPYDTNTSASFFDPAWMFGLSGDRPEQGGPFDIVIGNPPYVRQEQLRRITVTGTDGQPRSLKDALKDQYESYTGTADLYVYFFERSLQLLTIGGMLSFITSNKYFRAAYGRRLRVYLAYATRPRVVLDFGDAPLFTSIAYPCIIVTEKVRQIEPGQLPKDLPVNDNTEEWEADVMTWKAGESLDEFPEIFDSQAHDMRQRELRADGWRLEGKATLRLLERLRQSGKPLGDYVNGRFYYGIKTGYNKAFVVDRATRDRLIEEHASSENILKPFLRGRDVKRWRCEPKDLWLIFTRRGCDIEKFPAIHEYLKPMKDRLTPGIGGGRKPGGYKWFEIQDNIAYWKEFEQPKIIVPAITANVNYAPDWNSYYGNDKTSIIVAESVPFMLSILNSPVSWWITQREFASKQGGFFEFKPMYFSALPIPSATKIQQTLCESLANAIVWLFSNHESNTNQSPPWSYRSLLSTVAKRIGLRALFPLGDA